MANSRVGQYRLEIELTGFTAPIRSHIAGIWVQPLTTPAPGTDASAIDIQLLGGGSDTLDAVALDWANRIRVFYAASIAMSSFTLWRHVTEFSRDFVAAGLLSTTATATGAVTVAQQATFTFRHANGGIGKHVFIESNLSGDTRNVLIPNAVGNSAQRYAAWVLSAVSPCIALDNSFPVAPLADARGQNESVWRKVFRS